MTFSKQGADISEQCIHSGNISTCGSRSLITPLVSRSLRNQRSKAVLSRSRLYGDKENTSMVLPMRLASRRSGRRSAEHTPTTYHVISSTVTERGTYRPGRNKRTLHLARAGAPPLPPIMQCWLCLSPDGGGPSRERNKRTLSVPAALLVASTLHEGGPRGCCDLRHGKEECTFVALGTVWLPIVAYNGPLADQPWRDDL